MNILKNKIKGFTLMEIILVLVILGIIAAIVLPGILSQIDRHRGQEALNTMGFVRSAIESCGVQYNYDFSKCCRMSGGGTCDYTPLNMSDPSTAPSIFKYTYTGANGSYTITATKNGSAGDFIKMTKGGAGVVMTCTAAGIYGGLC